MRSQKNDEIIEMYDQSFFEISDEIDEARRDSNAELDNFIRG